MIYGSSTSDMAAVDEDLHSRAIPVWGVEGIASMARTNVLLIGVGGLGVEIAKNIILAGINSLTIHDPAPSTAADLSAQFYLTQEDIGRPRAEACVERLRELNSAVTVTHTLDEMTAETITKYQVVVSTDNKSWSRMVELNALCHANDIAFLAADVRGLAGMVFADFGEHFNVRDDGVEARWCMLSGAQNTEAGDQIKLTCCDPMERPRHTFENGDLVRFKEVQGCAALSDTAEPFTVHCENRDSFCVDFAGGVTDGPLSGIVEQVKVPFEVCFKQMADCAEEPVFRDLDFSKMDRASQLHQVFKAMYSWQEQHDGELPVGLSEIEQFAAAVTEHTELASSVARCASAVISPMCSVIGGITAQEVLKVCTAKFMPMDCWFYFDALECLPDNVELPTEAAGEGDRYSAMASVFGQHAFESIIKPLRPFVVGAGALGCEILKNLAMMGVGTAGQRMALTDMDTIEVSNLNRQFLFRPEDVGKTKSATAAAAASVMNPDCTIESYTKCMQPATETFFNRQWWDETDVVVLALDNHEARRYMDRQCIQYAKPLLDQGTEGTKGHTQVVIPHLTKSWGCDNDEVTTTFAVCTVKFYPYKVEHVVHWARDLFEGQFSNQATDVNRLAEDRDGFLSSLSQNPNKLAVVRSLRKNVDEDRPAALEQCVLWARMLFEQLFVNDVEQLLYLHPADEVTDLGAPYWSAPKRKPSPIRFDASEASHLNFIIATANLRAQVYQIEGHTQRGWFEQQASQITVPKFQVNRNATVPENDKEAEALAKAADPAQLQEFDAVVAALPISDQVCLVTPQEFEKDDDSNFHIDWIAACTQLRCNNYAIPSIDRNQTKVMAGNIIPAIATASALVAGLTALEMIKIALKKPFEQYKAAQFNLANNLMLFWEPMPPKKNTTGGMTWTEWDNIQVDKGGDITLKQLLAELEKHLEEKDADVEIDLVSLGKTVLFMSLLSKQKREARLPMKVSELAAELTEGALPDGNSLVLTIDGEDDEGEQVDLPKCLYTYR